MSKGLGQIFFFFNCTLNEKLDRSDCVYMSDSIFWVFYDSFAKIQSNFMTTSDAQASILKMRPQDVERYLIWTGGWQNWQPLKNYLESDQKNFVSTFTVSARNGKTEATVKAMIREVLENTQTNAHTRTNAHTQGSFQYKKSKKDDTITKSYSSIRLEEETISRIVRQEQAELEISTSDGKNFDVDEITWSKQEKPKLDFSNITHKVMSKRDIRHVLKIEILLISAKGKTFRSRSKNISLSGSLLEDSIPFDYYDSIFDVVIINTKVKDPSKSRVKLSGSVVSKVGNLSQRIEYVNVTIKQKMDLQFLLEEYIESQKKEKAG